MESQDKPIDSLNKSTVKPKNECKHVPIIITLSILLVASLGFGGYEFWQNSRQKDEIDSLQTEKNKAEESKTTEEKPSPKETEEEPSTEKKMIQ